MKILIFAMIFVLAKAEILQERGNGDAYPRNCWIITFVQFQNNIILINWRIEHVFSAKYLLNINGQTSWLSDYYTPKNVILFYTVVYPNEVIFWSYLF